MGTEECTELPRLETVKLRDKFKSFKNIVGILNVLFIIAVTVLMAVEKLDVGQGTLAVAGMETAIGILVGGNLVRHKQRGS